MFYIYIEREIITLTKSQHLTPQCFYRERRISFSQRYNTSLHNVYLHIYIQRERISVTNSQHSLNNVLHIFIQRERTSLSQKANTSLPNVLYTERISLSHRVNSSLHTVHIQKQRNHSHKELTPHSPKSQRQSKGHTHPCVIAREWRKWYYSHKKHLPTPIYIYKQRKSMQRAHPPQSYRDRVGRKVSLPQKANT